MLIMGVTYAQGECITDDCDIFEPENTEFDFGVINCNIDFDAAKTELEEIVELFFEELDYFNSEAALASGFYNPYSDVSSSSYNVTIDTFPFTYGAVADVSKSQNGSVTNVVININEEKYHELNADEYYPNDDVRALAYLKKRMLIYHELGHAVLGLGHPCNTEKDIMNTSQCLRNPGTIYYLSFPDDFPVENITTFENAVKRMFNGIHNGGQVSN